MPESATGFTSGYDEVLTNFSISELAATLHDFASQPKAAVRDRFQISGVFADKTFEKRSVISRDDNIPDRMKPFLLLRSISGSPTTGLIWP
jgi:hypothetical protein